MTHARMIVVLSTGWTVTLSCPVDEQELGELGASSGLRSARRLADEVLALMRREHGTDTPAQNAHAQKVLSVRLFDSAQITHSLTLTQPDSVPWRQDPPAEADGTSRRVRRCNSLLDAAGRLLPPSLREDAVDEWRDEIETAAEEGRPVVGRTLSMLRSVPILAWRGRRAVRVRPGEH